VFSSIFVIFSNLFNFEGTLIGWIRVWVSVIEKVVFDAFITTPCILNVTSFFQQTFLKKFHSDFRERAEVQKYEFLSWVLVLL
jgi:hypothetical protein